MLLWTAGLLVVTNTSWAVWFRFAGASTFNGKTVRHQGTTVAVLSPGGPTLIRVTEGEPTAAVTTWLVAILRVSDSAPSNRQPSYEAVAPAWLERATQAAIEHNERSAGVEPIRWTHYAAVGWPMRLLWVGRQQDEFGSRMRTVPWQGERRPAGSPGVVVIRGDWPLGVIWTGQALCAAMWLAVVATFPLGFSLRRRWRLRRGRCTACGYRLEGNTSGVCPECGFKVHGDTA
ncbi:MAG: hypothetical protein IT430_11600 [Phycisphaerales bacterium]|nr:hypothetical protein [Phycisphaerales bacterium]